MPASVMSRRASEALGVALFGPIGSVGGLAVASVMSNEATSPTTR
mgnify:CR=1 FL=1